MLKPYLQRLMRGEALGEDDSARAVGIIMDGAASPAQIAAFLVALRLKGETTEELTGAARAMRARMIRASTQRAPLLDTCGTGGDGAHTFNISTAAAFVVAAAGVAVAKHGNRAVSSRSGSADVLAAAGVNIEAPHDVVAACIDDVGLGFLFAPAWHPAMAHAMPVRRELGVRTLFNLLGPLTNPAAATLQLLGVYDRQWLMPFASVLAKLGSQRVWVVHGNDGVDEISICDITHVACFDERGFRELTVTPEDAGVARADRASLQGGDAAHNAAILRGLLQGEQRPEWAPLIDAVSLNAGAALVIADAVKDLRAGVSAAKDVLKAGKGYDVLQKIIVKTGGKA